MNVRQCCREPLADGDFADNSRSAPSGIGSGLPKTGSRRSRYNQITVRAHGKNRIQIAICRSFTPRDAGWQSGSTAFRRVQALLAGIVLAAAVAGILSVMLVVGSAIAVTIGVMAATAIALAIVVAAFGGRAAGDGLADCLTRKEVGRR